MTLDYPDWSRVASGSLRYLGTMTVAGTGTVNASFSINPSERSLLFVPQVGSVTTQMQVSGQGHITGMIIPQLWWDATGLLYKLASSVPVNASVDTQWDLAFTVTAGTGTSIVYVFASTDQAQLANIGLSQPVTIMQGTIPMVGRLPLANSLPVAISSGQAAGSTGQLAMAQSLPVVQPSDYPGVPTSWRKPYDAMLQHNPAAATLATVTFPATTGHRWVVDFARWEVFCAGTGASQSFAPIIQDGSTNIFVGSLNQPATTFTEEFIQLGPGAGYVGSSGAAVTVTFSGAPLANITERVNAAGYLMPAGM